VSVYIAYGMHCLRFQTSEECDSRILVARKLGRASRENSMKQISLICTVTLATTAALLELYTQQKKFKIIALILQCLHKVSLAGD